MIDTTSNQNQLYQLRVCLTGWGRSPNGRGKGLKSPELSVRVRPPLATSALVRTPSYRELSHFWEYFGDSEHPLPLLTCTDVAILS